jgi:hypothetical protein
MIDSIGLKVNRTAILYRARSLWKWPWRLLRRRASAVRWDSSKRCRGIASVCAFGILATGLPVGSSAKSADRGKAPDFGPNVIILDPTAPQSEIQSRIDAIAQEQKLAQFGQGRFAILLKPGTYTLDAKIAFYTQLAGLGLSPDDVTIHGHVQSLAMAGPWSVLVSFWRSAENMCVIPPDGTDHWAVSQAAPYRRMHVRGNLFLHDNGPGSGGFIADSEIEGTVDANWQQQWFTRNSSIRGWHGGLWNMVFVGVDGAPTATPENVDPSKVAIPGSPVVTSISETPVIAERPFLYVDQAGAFKVFVPSPRDNSQSISWASGSPAGKSLSMSRFFLAKPTMSAAEINGELNRGKSLILTPGIYHVAEPIRITHPDTIVMGLGLATILPENGAIAMTVADVGGVKISGILFDAGAVNSPTLLEVGPEGSSTNHAADPTFLYDIFARIGGTGAAGATQSVVVNSNNVVGDDLWLWRADHGKDVGWNTNTAANGLVVNGNDVTMYGLFVEHYQQYQVLWNGERGRTYFFQNEIPYDPPSQAAYMAGQTPGWSSYKVAPSVKQHEAWGMGSYIYEPKHPEIVLAHSFETPDSSGIEFRNLITFSLGPGKGTIEHVINDYGPIAHQTKFTDPGSLVAAYPPK